MALHSRGDGVVYRQSTSVVRLIGVVPGSAFGWVAKRHGATPSDVSQFIAATVSSVAQNFSAIGGGPDNTQSTARCCVQFGPVQSCRQMHKDICLEYSIRQSEKTYPEEEDDGVGEVAFVSLREELVALELANEEGEGAAACRRCWRARTI